MRRPCLRVMRVFSNGSGVQLPILWRNAVWYGADESAGVTISPRLRASLDIPNIARSATRWMPIMSSQLQRKQSENGTGAWIFLSHSHKDFEKVRGIRNELERRGHRPLMFFLKCLENDDALLPDLLKREISARQWFVLCDSPNAQSSRWVREEMEMIQAMEGKVFEKVDLSKDLETELHKLVGISKRATVFLSYARQGSAIAA